MFCTDLSHGAIVEDGRAGWTCRVCDLPLSPSEVSR